MFVILITAGRGIQEPQPIEKVCCAYVEEYGAENILFRHGMAIGGDMIGRYTMRKLGVKNIQDRPVRNEDWLKYGKAAGMIRNEEMLDEEPIPNVVLAFPDDSSKGTYGCIDAAIRREIPVFVYFDYLSLDNPKRMRYYFYGRETH